MSLTSSTPSRMRVRTSKRVRRGAGEAAAAGTAVSAADETGGSHVETNAAAARRSTLRNRIGTLLRGELMIASGGSVARKHPRAEEDPERLLTARPATRREAARVQPR